LGTAVQSRASHRRPRRFGMTATQHPTSDTTLL
jgi:hypothetical protein